MYKIGDLIMYGSTGVCRVEALSEEKFSLEDIQMYYVLQPLYQNGTIYAPVENNKVYMRPIISEDVANKLIDDMPSVEAEAVKCKSVQQLSKHYQSVIDTHDCRSLVKLTKSIHLKEEAASRQNKHLGQIDKKFMKRAKDLLFEEFAAALKIEKNEVAGYINRRVDEELVRNDEEVE